MGKIRQVLIIVATSIIVPVNPSLAADVEKLSQASKSWLSADEYLPYHPIGCSSIQRQKIGGKAVYFMSGCSRAGEWREKVRVVETITEGVIYTEGGQFVNGNPLTPAYWCSGTAPGFTEIGNFGTCAKSGWIPTRTQSP